MSAGASLAVEPFPELDSPLPPLLRERVLARLAAGSPSVYAVTVRACALAGVGVPAAEIEALLTGADAPPPGSGDARDEALGSLVEAGARWLRWCEAHPELDPAREELVRAHLGPLLEAAPALRGRLRTRVVTAAADAADAAQRLDLLAHVGGLLAGSLDLATTLRNLAGACIPAIADCCIVDLLQDGEVRRAAAAASDPEKSRLLEELRRRYPVREGSQQPAARVLKSGHPVLFGTLDDATIAAHAYDAEHTALVRRIGFGSYVAVPMAVGETVLGVLTLGYFRESGRAYEERDVALASEIGRRAALAIQNATLHEAVRRSQQKYAALVETTSAAVWQADAEGRVTAISPSWTAFTGQSIFAALDGGRFDVVHPADRARVEAAWHAAVAEGRGHEAELRLRRADGTYAHVIERGVPVWERDRTIREWVGSTEDVTARRCAEDKLREEVRIHETLHRISLSFGRELEEERLLQLVTDEATALTGAEFGALFFNVTDEKRGESFLLYTLSGAPRAAFEKFPLPRATPIFAHTFRGGPPLRMADVRKDPRYGAWGPQPTGHLPVVSYLAVPVVTRGKEVLGGLFFGHREADRFTEGHERLMTGIAAQAAMALETSRAYARVRESERRKDSFLAMLGHELRNPLAVISLNLERVRADAAPALQPVCDVLGRQTLHLRRLVDDLLDVSRITRGTFSLQRERISLGEVIRAALEVAEPLIRQQRHAVEASLEPDDALPVEGDRTRLVQAFANILSNAARYTPAGGRIRVSARRDGASCEVAIEDNGVGMEPALLPRVFDMFVQGDPVAGRAQEGLGVGLTLVRTIVELHGGKTEARSPGRGLGSTFTVRLPAAEGAAPAPLPQAAAAPATASGGKRRILVVDDNADLADAVCMVLEMAGHDVRVANDGDAALKAAAEHDPEAAIVDLGLPGMDGWALARKLREWAGGKPFEMIAVTGFGGEAYTKRSKEAGFDLHLVKPVNFAELAERLRK